MLHQWHQAPAGYVTHQIDCAAGWVVPDGPAGYAPIMAGAVGSECQGLGLGKMRGLRSGKVIKIAKELDRMRCNNDGRPDDVNKKSSCVPILFGTTIAGMIL